MSTLNKLAQVFVATALFVSNYAWAQVPSEPITIKRILANGAGCPLGTVAKNISDDKRAFSLTFSDFVAESGPGLSPSRARKNCVVTVTFKVPAGWQYSIGSFFSIWGWIEAWLLLTELHIFSKVRVKRVSLNRIERVLCKKIL